MKPRLLLGGATTAPNRRFREGREIGMALLLCLPLVGCGSSSMDDLRAYTESILSRESPPIEPLPEIKPYEVYAYQSADRKDPFESFIADEPEEQVEAASTSGIAPDPNRNREELEAFALDSLRMVGTVEKTSNIWGIVRAADGTVYQVQVNNYMGRNHGKVTGILEDRIELTEIIPDGTGGWQEREASLALIE